MCFFSYGLYSVFPKFSLLALKVLYVIQLMMYGLETVFAFEIC